MPHLGFLEDERSLRGRTLEFPQYVGWLRWWLTLLETLPHWKSHIFDVDSRPCGCAPRGISRQRAESVKD